MYGYDCVGAVLMTLYRFRFMNAVRDVFLNGAKLSDLKDLDNRGNVHHQLPS